MLPKKQMEGDLPHSLSLPRAQLRRWTSRANPK